MEGGDMNEYLAIDMGNTRTKIGYFKGKQLVDVWYSSPTELQEVLESFLATFEGGDLHVGWISVNHSLDLSQWPIWKGIKQVKALKEYASTDSFPLRNAYATPETLGIDRLVAVLGAMQLVSVPPLLVIDMGSAITYDVVDHSHTYLGGGISPGMKMRFRALSEFTARLPLVQPQKKFDLVGNSTHDCIRSGVVNGLLEELEGIIERYKREFSSELSVIISGGDAPFFEKRLKSVNFVEQNLVLLGVRELLSLSL